MEIPLSQSPIRQIPFKNKTYLYFGGTSYLGVTTLPDFQDLLIKNIKKWGTTYGSSRASNTKLSVYKNSEAKLATFLNAEATLTTSSGSVSGNIIKAFLKSKNISCYHINTLTHPAVLAEKSNPLFIKNILNPRLKTAKKEAICITMESINSLQVTPNCFNFVDAIPTHKEIILVVDESHSLGVSGNNGNGILFNKNLPKVKEKILISSLNKAYGVSGGIIAGNNTLISLLQNNPNFISASPMNPAYLETLIEAKSIYSKQLSLLKNNLLHLDKLLNKNSKIRFNKNYPVLYHTSQNITKHLLEKSIIITSFKYPTSNKKLNRIVISAQHSLLDINTLADALNTYCE